VVDQKQISCEDCGNLKNIRTQAVREEKNSSNQMKYTEIEDDISAQLLRRKNKSQLTIP
jgi:hypothetical protein